MAMRLPSVGEDIERFHRNNERFHRNIERSHRKRGEVKR